MSHVILQHPISMEIKKVPTGFSWTFFFFGMLVPIIRGDVLISSILAVIFLTMLFIPQVFVLFVILQVVGAFVYNEMYLNNLKTKGWVRCKYANVGG